MIKKISLMLISGLFCLVTMAQKTKTTGIVTDEKGKTLAGASVSIKGTKETVVTNSSGAFTIAAEKGAVLSVSFIGFETKEVRFNGEASELTIKLNLSEEGLKEVVVLGSRGIARTKLESTVPVDLFDIKTLITDVPQSDITGILNYVAPSFNSTP